MAICPNTAERLERSVEKAGFDFAVLADPASRASRAFGLSFRLSEADRKQYESFGIDLAEWSGHDDWELPVPAVFVVNAEGVVQFQYANPVYTKRLPIDVLVAMAKAGSEER